MLPRKLPPPSSEPLAYLDALAVAVSRGELTFAMAARLAQLVGPLVSDAELQEMHARLETLRQRVDELTSQRAKK